VFCPEDLEDHYHRQYHPQGLTRAQAQQQQQQQQHQQQQEEADRFAEALVPANSVFCSQPSLVLSPDGCEIAVARRLKHISHSTDLSAQNRSNQAKVSGIYQISPMCACHELQSTFLLPLSSLDVGTACKVHMQSGYATVQVHVHHVVWLFKVLQSMHQLSLQILQGPNESTTSEQTSSNAGLQAPAGLRTEMNYRPSIVLYVGHVYIVGKHKFSPPHLHA